LQELGLALRFAHSFGLVHGHLMANSIFFFFFFFVDADHRIQIADFGLIHLDGYEKTNLNTQVERILVGFRGEGWTPQLDIPAFESLSFLTNCRPTLPRRCEQRRDLSVQEFQNPPPSIIEASHRICIQKKCAFIDIIWTLFEKQCQIVAGE
jgi:hypothetical protein